MSSKKKNNNKKSNRRPKTKICINIVDKDTGELKPTMYVWLCDLSNKTKETEKAVLFSIGKTCSGLPIEAYIPKSTIIISKDKQRKGVKHVYVPLYVAKNKGVGWHDEATTYLQDDYISYNDMISRTSRTYSNATSNHDYYDDVDDYSCNGYDDFGRSNCGFDCPF